MKFVEVDFMRFQPFQVIHISTDPRVSPFEITFRDPHNSSGEVLIKDSYYFPEKSKAVLIGSEINQKIIIPGRIVRFGSLVIEVNGMRVKETGPDLTTQNIQIVIPGTISFDV